MADFKMDERDLINFQKVMKDMPSGFRRVVAEYLNTSAFTHRELSKRNLQSMLTIRDQRFLNNSLRVEKTRPLPIERQLAESGSIHWQKGTGWEEQQTGKRPERKRVITNSARGGSYASKVKPKYRLKPSNRIYKPRQYQGSFYFMMRVLGSRGGGEFYLDNKINTKRGALTPGLYNLNKKGKVKGKITMLQKKDNNQSVKRAKWSSEEWAEIKRRSMINSQKVLENYLAQQKAKNGL